MIALDSSLSSSTGSERCLAVPSSFCVCSINRCCNLHTGEANGVLLFMSQWLGKHSRGCSERVHEEEEEEQEEEEGRRRDADLLGGSIVFGILVVAGSLVWSTAGVVVRECWVGAASSLTLL